MESLERKKDLSDAAKQKRTYFAAFARAHASSFRPHWKEGDTLGRSPDRWRNVSEHCLVEGVLADVLAHELRLPPHEREALVSAALMHDWFKKREVTAQRAAERGGTPLLEAYEKAHREDAERLRSLGVPEHISRITDAIICTDRSGPQTLVEKAMWYADAILSSTEPMKLRRRFDDLERGWDGAKDDPARAARNRTFSDSFKPRYGGTSLFDVQREIAGRVEPELAQTAGFMGQPDEFPEYLKQKIEERIMSQT